MGMTRLRGYSLDQENAVTPRMHTFSGVNAFFYGPWYSIKDKNELSANTIYLEWTFLAPYRSITLTRLNPIDMPFILFLSAS